MVHNWLPDTLSTDGGGRPIGRRNCANSERGWRRILRRGIAAITLARDGVTQVNRTACGLGSAVLLVLLRLGGRQSFQGCIQTLWYLWPMRGWGAILSSLSSLARVGVVTRSLRLSGFSVGAFSTWRIGRGWGLLLAEIDAFRRGRRRRSRVLSGIRGSRDGVKLSTGLNSVPGMVLGGRSTDRLTLGGWPIRMKEILLYLWSFLEINSTWEMKGWSTIISTCAGLS